MTDAINKRKSEHIQLCLTDQVTGKDISTGFDAYRFIHNALPEINFDDISIHTHFLDRDMRTPFLISSMTGGAKLAKTINRNLATAAQEKGWTFALGSTRALIESKQHRESFQVRKYAPTIPIIANLGAVQLNYGFGVNECKQIMEITDADALVLHLNSIQEIIQEGGNTNFDSLLKKIEWVCKELGAPVGVKEVGFGIDGEVAKRLSDVGVSFIDVAGAGGTSWSQVEKLRSKEVIKKQAAEAFSDWGNPTADCLRSVRSKVDKALIASGGVKTGLDAAKAFALGADMAGFGRALLKEATQSVDDLIEFMEVRELELRMTMFGIGVSTMRELKETDRITLPSNGGVYL